MNQENKSIQSKWLLDSNVSYLHAMIFVNQKCNHDTFCKEKSHYIQYQIPVLQFGSRIVEIKSTLNVYQIKHLLSKSVVLNGDPQNRIKYNVATHIVL